MKKKDKPMIARIAVLAVAAIMIIGVFVSALNNINAAEATEVVIDSFTSGKLNSALDEKRGSLDINNITSVTVKSGTLTPDDLSVLKNLSSCEKIDLSGTDLESKKIDDYSFSGRSLTSVKLPKNTEIIGAGAFSGCGLLKEVIFPDTLKEIGNRAFESCSALTEIIIPQNIIKIDECAFRSCSKLEKVVIKAKEAPELVGNEVFVSDAKIEIPGNGSGYDEWKNTVKGSDTSDNSTAETSSEALTEPTAETSAEISQTEAVTDSENNSDPIVVSKTINFSMSSIIVITAVISVIVTALIYTLVIVLIHKLKKPKNQ